MWRAAGRIDSDFKVDESEIIPSGGLAEQPCGEGWKGSVARRAARLTSLIVRGWLYARIDIDARWSRDGASQSGARSFVPAWNCQSNIQVACLTVAIKNRRRAARSPHSREPGFTSSFSPSESLQCWRRVSAAGANVCTKPTATASWCPSPGSRCFKWQSHVRNITRAGWSFCHYYTSFANNFIVLAVVITIEFVTIWLSIRLLQSNFYKFFAWCAWWMEPLTNDRSDCSKPW